MATENSFDVVSKIDLQEVSNAVQQCMKEIRTRFDLKGTRCDVQLAGTQITIIADDEFKLKSVREVLEQKLVKRQVPLKGLTYGKIEHAFQGTVKQVADIQQGISTEKGREIVRRVKDSKLKVQASIQGDQIRISGRDKDTLQAVMHLLREAELGIHIHFTNYR